MGTADLSLEPLEPRQLMAVNVLNPIADGGVSQNSAATVISLGGRYDNPDLDGSIAHFETSLGGFNVVLYNNATPQTVLNFLRYVSEGKYAGTIIHRRTTVQDSGLSVIQGGGFQRPDVDNAAPGSIVAFPSVANEAGISNVRGTIAMAKVGGQPDSATSQWFINYQDNLTLNDPNNSGGFAVFGRVIGNGMTVVDAMAAVEVFNANTFYGTSNLYNTLPLRNFTTTPVRPENFVSMNISTVPELSYTVTSSNAALVNPALDGTNLTLNYGAGLTGTSTVTVRCTAADGSFVEDAFLVSVVGPPSIGAVVAAPQPAVTAGQMLTLTAQNITDLTNSLSKVQFYRDANGDGAWDAQDTLLGEDTNVKSGWSLKVSTAGMPEGENRFFARATAGSGIAGPAASVVHRIVPPPSVGTLTSSVTPIARNSTFNLIAGGVALPGAALKTVEFYRDTNGNGTFEVGIDKKVSSVSKLTDGAAIGKVASKGFSMGDNTFFARVQDKSGAWGPVTAATIAVANSLPTITGIKATPAVVKNVGDPITLAIAGGKDLDGKIVRVQYFRDTEIEGETQLLAPNGELDESDTLIGDVTAGGFKLVYRTTRLPLTENHTDRYFARVFDNDGGMSVVSMTDVRLNLPPTIGSYEVTPLTGDALTTFTFNAALTDPDGTMKSVEFFRDTNGNGVYDARIDKTLGKAKFMVDRWVMTLTGKKLVVGENRVFIRGTDNLGGFSQTPSTVITLT